MYNKQRRMAEYEHHGERYCFVHRLAELPVVAASLHQILHYYEKTKNYNRLFGALLYLAESSAKLAIQSTDPILKLLDGPIVATSKIASQQLDKLEQSYPILKATPEKILQDGKSYYNRSFVKSGVDTAYSVVLYGENKVRNSKKIAAHVVDNVLYMGIERVAALIRLSFAIVNQTLIFSDSLIDTYIAPPGLHNGPVFDNNDDPSIVMRVYSMSIKVYSGVKYRAGTGLVMTRDHIAQAISQMQALFVLIEYVRNTTHWMTEEAIAKLEKAQTQAANLLREIKEKTGKYGKQPEIALLKLVQNASRTFVAFSDYVYQHSSRYLPQHLNENIVKAVQYAQDLNETFGKASSMGELRDDVMVEAREKFAYIQNIFLSVADHLILFPPISWLASFTPLKGYVVKKPVANGNLVNEDVRKRY